MKEVLYSPPIIFALFLMGFALMYKWFSKYSADGKAGEHTYEPYACGQRDVENYVNPDYSHFFPYAFVFTVVHVLILVVATAPSDAVLLPVVYVVAGILSILISFKR